jgi:CAAX protease family protein
MEANLPARRRFPPANWGAGAAVIGLLVALAVPIFLAAPIALVTGSTAAHPNTAATVTLQALSEAAFFVAAVVVASLDGGTSRESLRRLGWRRPGPSSLKWMGVAVGAYIAFTIAYVGLIGEPNQKNVTEDLGPLPSQIVLIAVMAPISEETCFRGMLFGGLRERLPRLAAALIGGSIFGVLHVFNGIDVVPPLIVFGVILCLLYERTGSILPGIVLHILNNSVALLGS